MYQEHVSNCCQDASRAPDIKAYVITRLKMVGIESIFDLAISIPHQIIDFGGGMLTGVEERVALELVTKAKKALVDSGLLYKDFTAQEFLDKGKNLLRCTTGISKLNSFLKDPSNHRDNGGSGWIST
jgi:hypothetical protein